MDMSTKEQIEKNMDRAYAAEDTSTRALDKGEEAFTPPENEGGGKVDPASNAQWKGIGAITEPGVYLYKVAGEPVRLVEVSYDLKNVYGLRSDQMSGAAWKFPGLFYCVMTYPRLPL